MNDEAALKLGQLMIALAQRSTRVTLGIEPSVLHGNIYILKVYKSDKAGITRQVVETISETSLTNIHDVEVVADAMVGALR